MTKGTFANSSFFLENDVFHQTTEFWNVNPNVSWQPADNVKIDAQLNYGHSTFFREQPQFDFQTPRRSGLEVTYDNSGAARSRSSPPTATWATPISAGNGIG